MSLHRECPLFSGASKKDDKTLTIATKNMHVIIGFLVRRRLPEDTGVAF